MDHAPDTQTQLVTTAVHILLARAVHPGLHLALVEHHAQVLMDILAEDIQITDIPHQILAIIIALVAEYSN